MKTVITIRRNEVAALNDVLGTYGSKKCIKEISGWEHGMIYDGSFDPEGNYLIEFEISTNIILGLCQIAMDHSKAIKGLVKTLDGVIETVNYLSRNISRDLKNLFREYE